ncbi:uncharacterized protein PGRI_077930 [Penicillium griseofulvum]|uniref:Uncharacterized protein n=1 Tax=Penicillium patulum TaxID=5078 RepID=A0A135M0A5_PENPA|nr:uncharacterized protein PGRI_077930 [Penicillium griseofulvum]KXG54649.1 hypothetical protein PGRI_077930 [Penicillium griseofulvum]
MASVTCLAIQPSLDISKCEPVVTELKGCDSPIYPSEMAKVKRIDPPGNVPKSSSRRESQTSTSSSHPRSASRSTVRSRPNSRRSSFHSPRRAVPNAAIVPVTSPRTSTTSTQDKRESLLALHRESCRLFQGDGSNRSSIETRPSLRRTASTTYRSQREGRISTEKGSSEPSSPVALSYSSFRFEPESTSAPPRSAPHFVTSRDRSNTLPSRHHHSPSSSSIHVPATVMEWTSPDTRRREYEKIDRASSGVRGFWRRVAPRCFQTRDSRTPFFEEGKSEREGSVRRFRMDLPEDEELPSPRGKPQVQVLDLQGKNTSNSNSNPSDGARRRWGCLRSKSSTLPNA